MAAIRRRLTIEQGSTWSQTFDVVDSAGAAVDLTGHTARMTIREGRCPPGGGVVAGLTVAITDAAAGEVTASLTAEQTRVIWFEEGVYDLETVNGDTVTRRFEGAVQVNPEVSF